MSSKIPSVTLVSAFLLLLAANLQSQSLPAPPDSGSEPAKQSAPAEKSTRSPQTIEEDVTSLQKQAIQSYENGEYLRFVGATMKLRKLRPYEQQYMVGMVVGGALIERGNTAYNYMHVMQQQGLSYDFNSTEDTANIRGTEVYDYLNGLLIKNGESMGEGRQAFALPEMVILPECIAWDDSRGRFLVGTIQTGALLSVTPGGEVEELLRADDENGLMAITGIAVDPVNNRLWLSSAGIPGFAGALPTDLGRGALYEYNLETLELLRRREIPVDGLPHIPGSLVVSAGGDVYLMDRALPMLFRKPADSDHLELYLASKELVGFRDLAISDTGDRLYVADTALGILVVNLEDGRSGMLAAPDSLNLGGISGLTYSEGSLLMLQNTITPQRLMRLKLDADGTSVVETVPLAVALDQFDAPSFGTVQGGALYYFASSNRPGGIGEPRPVVVMKTPTVLSEPIIPVEKRMFDEDTWGGKKKD